MPVSHQVLAATLPASPAQRPNLPAACPAPPACPQRLRDMEQHAAQLQALLQALQAVPGAPAGLPPDLAQLLGQLQSPSAFGPSGTASREGAGSGGSSRLQRSAARIAQSFPVIGGKQPLAGQTQESMLRALAHSMGGAPQQAPQFHQPSAAHNPATCLVAGCPACLRAAGHAR